MGLVEEGFFLVEELGEVRAVESGHGWCVLYTGIQVDRYTGRAIEHVYLFTCVPVYVITLPFPSTPLQKSSTHH